MLRLSRFLKKYWLFALLAPLFMLLEVTMDLQQPKLMARIVNDGILAGNLEIIGRNGLTMIVFALIGLLGGVLCTVFSSIAAQKFAAQLRVALFAKVQAFSFDQLENFETGSLVTRLTGDVVQMQNLVIALLRNVARSSFLVVGSVIMAVTISPQLTMIEAIFIPFLLIILTVTTRLTIPLFSKLQRKLDGVNTVLQENLSGIRVVKAFVRMDYEEVRFNKANTNYMAAGLKAARTAAINMPLMSIVLNTGIVTAIWYGGGFYQAGKLTIGELVAFCTYITQLLNALLNLGNQIVMFARGKASADRMNEVLDTETIADVNPVGPLAYKKVIHSGRIDFQHVSFAYGPDDPVLHDLSFTIEPGQTVGILGTNGAGKSTLVGLISRIHEATEGTVRIDGRPIREIAASELHNRIGVVLQQAILFSGTVRDNIRFGHPEASQEEVEAAAKAAEAHSFIMKLPDNYDTQLGQRGVNLSGGQKQRLSIARTLLIEPKILILDDSMSAVDLQTEARIRKSLMQLSESSTCVIIAQRIASIQHADRVFVLEKGKITAMGTHQELLNKSSFYRDTYESEQRKGETIHGHESTN